MHAPAYGLDMKQVRRAFARAADTCAQASMVTREVERRMAERLDYIKCDPARVLDAGTGLGEGLALLRRRFPRAELIGVDIAHALLRRARRAGTAFDRLRALAGRGRVHWACGDLVSLPLKSASVDLVWSNLALAWASDPLAALAEFRRVLVGGGLLMFSTYGPDTLKELRTAFGARGARRVHSFVDMHDLGDMLVAGGFAAPVMDMEMITLTYPDVGALARELRASGQTSAARERPRGLTGRGEWRRMAVLYENERKHGKLPATIEIVYGHAWKGEPRITADGRQVMKLDFKSGKSR